MSRTSKILLKTMEEALKNTIIAKSYNLSLKSFFKDSYRYWNDCYLIPFTEVKNFQKHVFEFIKSGCNNERICSKLKTCDGHQFLYFIEFLLKYQRFSITHKKVYYKYFLFTNFKLQKIALRPTKIKSWRVVAVDQQKVMNCYFSK